MQSLGKTKPHVLCTRKWGLQYFLYGAFVSHASSITERFAAKNFNAILLKCAGEVKELGGIGKKDTG